MTQVDVEKSAVVTGASTGIGRAIAASLIRAGWRVFGSVRKQADADTATAALGSSFTPLLFDVTDAVAIANAARQVEAALGGRTLGGLVNNAGIAVAGPVARIPLAEIEHQIDVNVYGPIRAIQSFLPLLGADRRFQGRPGRIVNMSSVAGRITAPFMAPYAMSKHALEALSDALRRELVMHGVDVIVVGPGAVRTPIWAKADEVDVSQYQHTEYRSPMETLKKNMQTVGADGLPAEAVGDLVRHILEARHPKTRYAILKNKFFLWTLPQLLPPRMVDKAVARRFEIKAR